MKNYALVRHGKITGLVTFELDHEALQWFKKLTVAEGEFLVHITGNADPHIGDTVVPDTNILADFFMIPSYMLQDYKSQLKTT
jgi:hypothetical protein